MIGIFFTLANDCNFFLYITYGLEISIVVIVFTTVFSIIRIFLLKLLTVIDYSKTDVLLKNIYQFFSDLPIT